MQQFLKALSVVLGCVAGMSALADQSCQLNRVAAVDIRITPGGLIAYARLGDRTLPFYVDTRLATGVIFESAVSELGLPTAGTRTGFYVDIDDRPIFERAEIPYLMLGQQRFSDSNLLVSRRATDSGPGAAVGVLGADLLRNFDVEIDPAAGKLYLYEPERCPGKAVYWAKEYFVSPLDMLDSDRPALDVELDGHMLHAMLSTGIGDTLLAERAGQQYFQLQPASAGMKAAGSIDDLSNYPIALYQYPFKSLKFGQLTIRNPQIELAATGDLSYVRTHFGANDVPDLLVGMNFLKKFHLYIATQEGKLYYTMLQS